MKQWWCGSPKVEPFMNDVRSAIARHLPDGAAQVDIYNRAYEAVYAALQSIESPRDWTPCADEMPEDDPTFEPMSRYECTILIPDGTREVFTLHRTGNGRWLYETGKGLDSVRGDQVIAWRKVSDPYTPDRKDNA